MESLYLKHLNKFWLVWAIELHSENENCGGYAVSKKQISHFKYLVQISFDKDKNIHNKSNLYQRIFGTIRWTPTVQTRKIKCKKQRRRRSSRRMSEWAHEEEGPINTLSFTNTNTLLLATDHRQGDDKIIGTVVHCYKAVCKLVSFRGMAAISCAPLLMSLCINARRWKLF